MSQELMPAVSHMTNLHLLSLKGRPVLTADDDDDGDEDYVQPLQLSPLTKLLSLKSLDMTYTPLSFTEVRLQPTSSKVKTLLGNMKHVMHCENQEFQRSQGA